MDFILIIAQVLSNLWYLVVIAIFVVVIKSPWFKGMAGEFIVNIRVKLFLDKEQYRLVKNGTLPTGDGTTQIDHIIVSEFGVFVVETKNLKGRIFGGRTQKRWTQRIGRQSSEFQNPLHQNYKHIKVLKSLLGLSGDQLFSVIVFVGDGEFKTDMPENVTYGAGCIRFIKSKTIAVLTNSQVKDVTEKIKAGRLTPSSKENREHVRHVQSIIAKKIRIEVALDATATLNQGGLGHLIDATQDKMVIESR